MAETRNGRRLAQHGGSLAGPFQLSIKGLCVLVSSRTHGVRAGGSSRAAAFARAGCEEVLAEGRHLGPQVRCILALRRPQTSGRQAREAQHDLALVGSRGARQGLLQFLALVLSYLCAVAQVVVAVGQARGTRGAGRQNRGTAPCSETSSVAVATLQPIAITVRCTS